MTFNISNLSSVSTTSNRLTKEEWATIEKPLSKKSKEVMALMRKKSIPKNAERKEKTKKQTKKTKKQGKTSPQTDQDTQKSQAPQRPCVGDISRYIRITKSFMQENFPSHPLNDIELPPSETERKKKGKQSMKDKIIEENNLKRYTNKTEELLSVYKRVSGSKLLKLLKLFKHINRSEPVEFIVLRMIISCVPECNWVIKAIRLGLEIEQAEKLGSFSVCAFSKHVLHSLIEKMKEVSKFSYEKLNETDPSLFLSNESILKNQHVELRPFQQKLINTVNMLGANEPIIINLNAMIGSGKTVAAIAIAHEINNRVNLEWEKWRSAKVKSEEFKQDSLFVFVCATNTVRIETARCCYSENIPYSIVSWDCDKKVPRITPSWMSRKQYGSRNQKTTQIVSPVKICDPLSAIYLLEKMSTIEKENVCVYLDEPTIGADQEDSSVSKILVPIMYSSPRVVWSSGTMPKEKELQEIISHWKSKYPGGKYVTISSNINQTGCQLHSMESKKFYPHGKCKTKEDIVKLKAVLDTEPLVARMYTAEAVFQFHTKMCNNPKSKIDSRFIEDMLMKNKNTGHSTMISIFKTLLDELLKTPEIIEDVCGGSLGERGETLEKEFYNDNLLDSEFEKSNGQTLIATNAPIKYLREALEIYLAQNEKYPDSSIDKCAKHFEELVEEYKKPMPTIPSLECKKGELDQSYIQEAQTRHLDISKIRPLWGDKPSRKNMTIMNRLAEHSHVPSWINMALLVGIGVYSNDSALGKKYKNTVLELASQGKLRFIVVDDSIIYGTNWPVSNVICMEDMAETHSVLTLIQLFGRAGRVNQCYLANIYTSEKVIERVFDFLMNRDKRESIEGKNMVKAFRWFQENI